MASDPQVPILSSCLDFPQLWTVIRIVSQTLFFACCFWPQCFLTAIGNKIKRLSCEVKNKSPWVGSLLQEKFAYGSECNFFFAATSLQAQNWWRERIDMWVLIMYVYVWVVSTLACAQRLEENVGCSAISPSSTVSHSLNLELDWLAASIHLSLSYIAMVLQVHTTTPIFSLIFLYIGRKCYRGSGFGRWILPVTCCGCL